jgi:methylmalonyl-CoA mutase N-terminal domain/subunit
VADALGALERAARDGANVVGPVVDAVKAYVTLGEISDVFRNVHGVYRDEGRI